MASDFYRGLIRPTDAFGEAAQAWDAGRERLRQEAREDALRQQEQARRDAPIPSGIDQYIQRVMGGEDPHTVATEAKLRSAGHLPPLEQAARTGLLSLEPEERAAVPTMAPGQEGGL